MDDFRILAIQTQSREVLEIMDSIGDVNESMDVIDKIRTMTSHLNDLDRAYNTLMVRIKKFLGIKYNKENREIPTQYGRLKQAIIEDLDECLSKLDYLVALYKIAELKDLVKVVERIRETVLVSHYSR